MSAFDVIQAVLLSALLAYSLVVALRKLAPEFTRRWLGNWSARLDAPTHARLTRRIGRWMQPAQARNGGCGSGDGCGTCRACAPSPALRPDASIPLHVRPRRHS